ncbi:hypothetical protein [Nonomuraea wenchangensis]|uniref:hypothetical protein n=1 Tax=Nonomuraea wenchangensis TaxID=568860 RepID=UPI00331ED925
MATYQINKGWDDHRTVKADSFKTQGDFVDFYERRGNDDVVVLRLRATAVQEVELVND